MLMTENIVYEDKHIIVCHKPSGIATQTSRLGEPDMVSDIKNYLGNPYTAVIHRLDQPVEGILVFAKTKEAAAELCRQNMEKKYYAAVFADKHEILQIKARNDRHTLINYLLKNGRENTSKVVNKEVKDAKKAELDYHIIDTYDNVEIGNKMAALLEVNLKTGRHHQIRVQMSNAGMPLLGDWKYGSEESMQISRNNNIREICLCAYSLSFTHPFTKKRMDFSIIPRGKSWKTFFPVNP